MSETSIFKFKKVFAYVLIIYLVLVWVLVSLHLFSKESEFGKFFDLKTTLYATIISDPEKSGQYAQKFEVSPQGYSQKILVTTYNRKQFEYGDQVLIIGKVTENKNFSENFSYVGYLQAKNIYAQMTGTETYILNKTVPNYVINYGLKIKHWFYAKLQENLPKEQAALLIALLVGDKGLLTAETKAEFSKTGVAHLIAVSSYILTVILILATRLKQYIGKTLTIFSCCFIILLYLIMADFSAGMMRAAIMFGLLCLSRVLGRQYNPVRIILFTAAVLVTFNPLIIKYDLGFMFSFSAILGIVIFSPLFQKILAKKPKLFPEKFGIREILSATLAAQLATTPLTIYYFDQLPIISPIANLIIVPIVTPTVLGGYFLIIPLLSKIWAKVMSLPLTFILEAVSFMATLPFASLQTHISSPVFVLLYLLELPVYFLLKYLSN